MGSIAYKEPTSALFKDTRYTDESFALASEDEISQYRALVPAAARKGITYLNASFQPPMNTRIRGAVDQFLDQNVNDANPKPEWQKNTIYTRSLVASYLNAPFESLAFTRDTTESLNLFQRSIKFQPGDNVVILDVEHPNHAYGWLALVCLRLEIRRVPTGTDTFAAASTFAPYVDERTVAIGLSSVMFHSGQMNDVKDICARFRPQGVHVLVDATQHVGVAPIDVQDWCASAIAFSCHKGLGCPTGLAVLYIEPEALLTLKAVPPIVGAGAIANLPSTLLADPNVVYHSTTARYDHLNLSLISMAALKASLTFLLNEVGIHKVEHHLRGLGRELALQTEALGVEIVGSQYAGQRSPHIYVLKLLHPNWQSHFSEQKVYVSHYRCGVRVSFGFYNNKDDVAALVRSIKVGLDKGIPLE